MMRVRSGLLFLALLAQFGCAAMSPKAEEPLQVISVAMAKQQIDRTPVMLEGYITDPLGNQTYLFNDSTGDIQVVIDDNLWLNVRVGPKTKVRIIGRVDGDYGSADLDIIVEQIQVLREETFPAEQ